MRTRLSFEEIRRLGARMRSELQSDEVRRLGARLHARVSFDEMRRLGERLHTRVDLAEFRRLGARVRTGREVDDVRLLVARLRTRLKSDDVRLLGALALLLILGFAFIPRAADAQPGVAPQLQRENALAEEPAGTAWPVPSDDGLITGMAGAAAAPPPPPPTPTPAPTATPTPTPTPEPAPAVAADGFSAQVLACQSISGGACQGELTSTSGLGSFTALVLLENTLRGDVIEAHLIGDSVTFSGGGYTVGGGDGWYYTTFVIGGVPPGTYALVVTRNGVEVDSTTLVIG